MSKLKKWLETSLRTEAFWGRFRRISFRLYGHTFCSTMAWIRSFAQKPFNSSPVYFCLTAFIFLTIPVVTTFDSAWYHKYLEIMFANGNWQEWDYVRGIAFPTFLKIMHLLFGYSQIGALLCFCCLFLFSIRQYELIFDAAGIKRTNARLICFILFTANPIYMGYSHALLTEAPYFALQAFAMRFAIVTLTAPQPPGLFHYGLPAGTLLYLAYQTKESYALMLCCLLGAWVVANHRISRRIQSIGLAIIAIGLMLLFNSLTLRTLALLSQRNPAPAANSFLRAGISYGSLHGSTLDTLRTKWDYFEQISTEVSGDDGCWIENRTNTRYVFKRMNQEIRCPLPDGAWQALIIRSYLTTITGWDGIFFQHEILKEALGINTNRFNENNGIALHPFRVAISGGNNVMEINPRFDYAKYVEPYYLKMSERPSVLVDAFYYLKPIYERATTFFYTIALLAGSVSLFIFRSNVLVILGIAASSSLFISFFLGMIIDRYIFAVYPISAIFVILTAKYVLSARRAPNKDQKRKVDRCFGF